MANDNVYDFQGRSSRVPIGAGSGQGGGDMEDILRRLGAVEKDVSDIKSDVSGIKAQVAHLASKSDVSDAKTSIIQWTVATLLAVGALAFAIARFIH